MAMIPIISTKTSVSLSSWRGEFQVCKYPLQYIASNPRLRCSPCSISCKIEVDTEKLKRRLIKKGFMPTPKIIHRLRKKEIQKAKRKAKKNPENDVPKHVKKVNEEKALFESASREFETLMAQIDLHQQHISEVVKEEIIGGVELNNGNAEVGNRENVEMKGKPWERAGGIQQNRLSSNRSNKDLDYRVGNDRIQREGRQRGGRVGVRDGKGRIKGEGKVDELEKFRKIIVQRKGDLGDLGWLLHDDLDEDVEEGESEKETRERPRAPIDEEKQIQWLVERLNSINFKMPSWQLSKLMHSARMKFTDGRLVRIIQILGDTGRWRQAVEVVHWVHKRKRYKYCKGRYVYTTLLAVLGKAMRPVEALNVFHAMREHISSYPDMPAYHCIATTLGKAGYLKELLNIIDCLRTGPAKLMKNVKFLHWDPRLEPDLVVYNAVLNACVPWKQWKGAFWVLQQMRQNGLRPSCATYGLTIEVMLASGKYDLVHIFFEKMAKAGLPPNASTYKAIIRAFWKEGKTNEAVRAVEEMKSRGVVPTASVYYELACGLCSAGRWQDALLQVDKLHKCPSSKPLAVTFTGLIQCCAEVGRIDDCTCIFNSMQDFCAPNIGAVNAMIKAYGENNMFKETKMLFEEIKKGKVGLRNLARNEVRLSPDIFTYNAMIEACGMAQEWEYLDNVYKQMILHGHLIDHRHAWLIVAASRAGKTHLLHHTFDQLLEQGKTPHVSLFKEKICQCLQSDEYAKFITYITSMANCSVELSQNEWTYLFKRNATIGKDRLYNLLVELDSSAMDDNTRSPIFRNLITSLQLLSGDVLSEPIKFMNPSTLTYKEVTHQHLNTVLLYSTDENDKVAGNTQYEHSPDNRRLHEEKPKLGAEEHIRSPFQTDAVDDDVNNLGDPNLPSSYNILMEWRQGVQQQRESCAVT